MRFHWTVIKLTSADSSVVSVIEENVLKAVGFGTTKVTAKYEKFELIFIIVFSKINALSAVCGEFKTGEKITLSYVIENCTKNTLLNYTRAAALYKNNLLLDVKFEPRVGIGAKYGFNITFMLPEGDCYIYLMFLNENAAIVSDSKLEKK